MPRFVTLCVLAALTGVVPAPAGAAGARNDMLGEVSYYVTRYEDTFVDLARRFDVGYVELMAANPGVDPWVPGEGRRLTLPTAHLLPNAPREGIVINLAAMRLYYFPPKGAPVTYPVGIGKEGYRTPLGTTRVVRKEVRPTWFPPPSVRADRPELPAAVPPGPDNPLGEYGLYTGWPGYIIHGTNRPPSIGRRLSYGCIRLYPEDIAALYRMVPVGTAVRVIDDEVTVGWVGDELYLQAFPSQEQADEIEDKGRFAPRAIEGLDSRVRVIAAANPGAADRIDWETVLRAARERRGIPVKITR